MSDEDSNLPASWAQHGETMSREDVIFAMKMQGASTADIASELQVTPATVTSMVRGRLRAETETIEDEERTYLLDLENARLDYYLTKLWAQINYGDVKAIMAALKITETRIKMNRMDEVTSTAGAQVLVIGGESDSYIEKLKKMTED